MHNKRRNRRIIVLAAIMALLIITAAGCQKKDTSPVNPANQTGQISPADAPAKDKSIVEVSKPKTDIEQVEDIVKNKTDIMKAVTFYKALMQKLAKGDPARQKLIDYIMAESLKMVQSTDKKKIQTGLDVALALNDIEAGDYYIQNRIIYAYTNFAKIERAAGNFDKARGYTEKALIYHFAAETMRLRLEILMDEAKQYIAAKKYTEAQALLKEVIDISGVQENTKIYAKEEADARALLKTIPQ